MLLFISFLLISFTGISQVNSAIVEFKNPSSVASPKGYSQVAVIDLGNCQMIVLSGQVPLDSSGNLIGKDDIARQTEQVFLNIQKIVSEFGGTMDNVIKTGIYMVDISQIQTFREIRDKFINLDNPPTSTLVQVNGLFRDDVLIEVEATALIPKR